VFIQSGNSGTNQVQANSTSFPAGGPIVQGFNNTVVVTFPFGPWYASSNVESGALAEYLAFFNCSYNINSVYISPNKNVTGPWVYYGNNTSDGTGFALTGPRNGNDAAHNCGVAIWARDNGRGDVDSTAGKVTTLLALAVTPK